MKIYCFFFWLSLVIVEVWELYTEKNYVVKIIIFDNTRRIQYTLICMKITTIYSKNVYFVIFTINCSNFHENINFCPSNIIKSKNLILVD